MARNQIVVTEQQVVEALEAFGAEALKATGDKDTRPRFRGFRIVQGIKDLVAKALVQTRIDAEVKEQATVVLESMGLTVSDVVRIVLTRVAKDKALPFEMRVPNRPTAETLTKSERGEDGGHYFTGLAKS